jgi:hypothetical protein
MSQIATSFHRFANEAANVGRLLITFRGLEYKTVACAGRIIGDQDGVLKALYRLTATCNRIDSADALMRRHWNGSLLDDYIAMIDALKFFQHIHAQFASCVWSEPSDAGLAFANPEETSTQSNGFQLRWRHVNSSLLADHESYFASRLAWLTFLEPELVSLRGGPRNILSKPRSQKRPPMYVGDEIAG